MSNLEYVYMTVIAASPEKVWEGLTTAEFTKQYWHSTRVKSDWTIGSKIEFYVDSSEGEAIGCEGEILKADHPNELSYTWRFPRNPDVKDEASSRVTFTLKEKGGNTVLTVTHDEFPEGSKMFESVSQGWPLVLAGLKTLLETGRAVDFSIFED